MTVSMRVMSAGDGYKYLLRTVAAADGDRSLSTPLTRYYAEAGTLFSAFGFPTHRAERSARTRLIGPHSLIPSARHDWRPQADDFAPHVWHQGAPLGRRAPT